MNKIGRIVGTEDGGLVNKLLQGMLEMDYRKRMSVDELLNSFSMLYQKVGG